MNSYSDQDNDIPQENLRAAKKATNDILPERSKVRYEKAYDATYYKVGAKQKNIKRVNEEVLLAYFVEKSEKLASSTL